MTLSKSVKTGALAIALICATAGTALAADGWMTHDQNVFKQATKFSPKVNWVHGGQAVNVVAATAHWYRIKIPGQDGWVRKSRVTFDDPHAGWGSGWGPGWGTTGASFCVNGDKAQFCFGAHH